MATKFEPLSLDNIDQGSFVEDAQQAFRKLQDELVRHVRDHGNAEAVGRLTLNVELKHKQGAVYVTTSIDKRPPAIPKMITTAMIDNSQDTDEELVLFTAVGGSNSDTPAQQQLCNRKGEPINPA